MAKKEIKAKERYYYKDQNGHPAYNLKEPLENILEDTTGYVEITKAEWDELTYVPPVEPHVPTEEEKAVAAKKARIAELKKNLFDTDYVALKLAEGETTKEEYAEVFANRRAWRAEINELESELGGK